MSPEPTVSAFRPATITTAASNPESAHGAGYAAGWAAGARAAAEAAQVDRDRLRQDHIAREAARDAEVARTLDALNAAIESWNAKALPIVKDAQRSVYAAALDLAQSILQRELEPGERSARVLLARALDLPNDVTPTVLRVSPEDLRHVNLVIESGQVAVTPGLALVADPRLARGEAITEHADGALDARIGTALERAKEILLGESS